MWWRSPGARAKSPFPRGLNRLRATSANRLSDGHGDDIDVAYILSIRSPPRTSQSWTCTPVGTRNLRVGCLVRESRLQLAKAHEESLATSGVAARSRSVLAEGSFDLTVLRAAVIIGPESASFRIVDDLTDRLPLMLVPSGSERRVSPRRRRRYPLARGVLDADEPVARPTTSAGQRCGRRVAADSAAEKGSRCHCSRASDDAGPVLALASIHDRRTVRHRSASDESSAPVTATGMDLRDALPIDQTPINDPSTPCSGFDWRRRVPDGMGCCGILARLNRSRSYRGQRRIGCTSRPSATAGYRTVNLSVRTCDEAHSRDIETDISMRASCTVHSQRSMPHCRPPRNDSHARPDAGMTGPTRATSCPAICV